MLLTQILSKAFQPSQNKLAATYVSARFVLLKLSNLDAPGVSPAERVGHFAVIQRLISQSAHLFL